MMLKRILIGVVLTALLALLVQEISRRLASDEDKILRQLETLAEAFSEEDNADFLNVLTADWRDETQNINRSQLPRLLSYAFLNRGFRVNGKFAFRARIDRPSFEVETEVEVDRAEVHVEVVLDRRDDSGWIEIWRLALELQFKRVDGVWLLDRSRHRAVSGKSPF